MGRLAIAVWLGTTACSIDAVTFLPTGEPPAGSCRELGASCVAPTVLRECRELGAPAVETACPWGCVDGEARCGVLQPAGGVLTEADLRPEPGLPERVLMGPGVIHSVDGTVMAGSTAVDGFEFQIRAVGGQSTGVFRFGKLTLVGDWSVRGRNAIAIASLGDVVIQGQLDLRGVCALDQAGPGGNAGGGAGSNAAGAGGGQGGPPAAGVGDAGGGGGGHGARGGDGGSPGLRPRGGDLAGDAGITRLIGGGGGGGGGGVNGGRGGGGGGALHLAANGRVAIRLDPDLSLISGINAGGCGGKNSADGGGGGGAGGTILIEASEVELDGAHLAVNGGGGGGRGGNATAGTPGQLGIDRAAGGEGSARGGRGGAAGVRPGEQGGIDVSDGGGGGGGGVGRIRIHTRLPDAVTVVNGALVSPTFEEPNTTSTKGTATVR